MRLSSIWNRLTFGWITGELYRGYMHDEEYSMDCINGLVHSSSPKGNTKVSSWGNIFKSYKFQIILAGVFKLAGDLSSVYSVRLIKSVIEGFKKRQDHHETISSLVQLLLVHIVHTLGFNHHDYLMHIVGFKVRNHLSMQIYSKCLHLNDFTDRGMILNLLSNDVVRVSGMFGSLHNIWISPFPVVWILYSLYELLGWFSFVGFSVIFLYIPLQFYLTKRMNALRKV